MKHTLLNNVGTPGTRNLLLTSFLSLSLCSGGSSNDTESNELPIQQAVTPATTPAARPPTTPAYDDDNDDDGNGQVSPVLIIQRGGRPHPPRQDPRPELEERTIAGSNNNLASADIGAAGIN